MLVPSLWKNSWRILDDYVTEMGPSSFTIRMQVQSWKRVLDDCRTSTLWLFRNLRNRETWFQNGRACQVSQSKLPKLGRKARHSCKTGRLGSGFEQHRSKWSEIGNGSILHKWNQVGWLLYINVILFCAYFDQNKNEIHVFDVFKVHPVVWICSSLSRQSTRVSDLCFSRSPGRNSKKSQLAQQSMRRLLLLFYLCHPMSLV